MKILIIALILGVFYLPSCSVSFKKDEPTEKRSPEKANADLAANKIAESETANGSKNSESAKNVFGDKEKAKTDCANINTGDKTLLKSQTFPIDFAPYKNSCFVTAHEPEYTDPPLNSEFSIYRNGEEVFFFPGQFNGVTTGCWVDAVSFQDLNGDNLTDIIVVGKCGAKSGPYNENMVYVNTGTTFITDEDANYKLADFQKAGEISDFVKRNKQLFF
jgi:hypothetical protein